MQMVFATIFVSVTSLNASGMVMIAISLSPKMLITGSVITQNRYFSLTRYDASGSVILVSALVSPEKQR